MVYGLWVWYLASYDRSPNSSSALFVLFCFAFAMCFYTCVFSSGERDLLKKKKDRNLIGIWSEHLMNRVWDWKVEAKILSIVIHTDSDIPENK